MSMDVLILAAADTAPDELRGLLAWLDAEDEVRGAARLVEGAPRPGRLGATTDALQVVVGSASSAFAAALIAWLRTRTGRVRIVLKGPDGRQVELDATTVRALDGAAVSGLIGELAAGVGADSPK